MIVELDWKLGLALALLVLVTVVSSWWGRLGLGWQSVIAAARAAVQLAAVSLIIVACMQHLALAALFSLAMFAVAVRTTVKRTKVGGAWPWTALAMLCGIAPVLLAIFGSGASPLNGAALIPLAGIIVGNMMTAHTLFGRRQFPALREGLGQYEAALSLGFQRDRAIDLVTRATRTDALVPTIDTTRTVGLVTLPGAFVGVLLGGGSALQAGASQLLVLVGIMAGQSVTVVMANKLMCAGKLLPDDLRGRLRP